MTACPRPQKARYATQIAAETAAARVALGTGLPMRPYEYSCTWWHLTKSPAEVIPEPGEASQSAIERLDSIPDIDFRNVVASDVRGAGDRDERAALRHPRNLKRWQRQLGELTHDIEKQLADRKSDKTPAAGLWRTRALDYRDRIALRASECRRRRSEAHVELMKRGDARRRDAELAAARGATAKELRKEAGELAVHRLIAAHRDEFERYIVEEYQAFGLTIPDRFEKWTRQDGTPASGPTPPPDACTCARCSHNPTSTAVHRGSDAA
ncbi:hypothetical protein [Streptomyces sp. NPDC057293]|uniref:hypothetical protein n=1 Tax=unclassified Streptomyces TaxID=2593676 RepID=UPI00363E65FE